jgi:hypothetical protein
MISLHPALAALLLSTPFLAAAPTYTFTLDGKPADPRILPVHGEAKGSITEGDIAFLDDFTFVVGKPGRHELRIEGERDSELLCRFNDGPEHHLALRILKSYDDDKHRIDALATLDARQRKVLRGITLEVPTKDWNTAFRGIDWTATALSISDDVADEDAGDALPPLPDTLRYLKISINSSPSIADYSSLRPLKDLRFLDLRGWGTFDFGLLSNAGALRNLSVQSCPVENPDALSSLTRLRFLKLRWTDKLATVAFASAMPELRVLKIDDTGVTDLRPLDGRQHLRLISATEANISVLPDATTLPALRDLRLLSTPVASDADAMTAFQAAAPDCVVKHGWAQTLRHAVAGTTRLRVRTGGTCHRNPASEKTLFEITKTGMIDSLVRSLDIDEERSGFHCMCCGNPSLEFYKGDTLLATLGFHHGRSLRWSGGLWPGDSLISNENADLLCDLMADNGYTGPKEERDRQKASDRAGQRYWDAVLAIVPEAVLKSAWTLANPDPDAEDIGEDKRLAALEEVFSEQWPDATERARNLFTIYGALPEMSWNLTTGVDELVRDHLPEHDSGQISTLLADVPDEQVLQGIARWCFFDRTGVASRLKLADTELATLSTWGLSHPRDVNRRKTLLALDSKPGESFLLAFLRNPSTPRPLAEELRPEPGGSVTFTPESRDLPDDVSDRITAAFILAQRACAAARPTIKKLSITAPENHRPHYLEALKILDEKAE